MSSHVNQVMTSCTVVMLTEQQWLRHHQPAVLQMMISGQSLKNYCVLCIPIWWFNFISGIVIIFLHNGTSAKINLLVNKYAV